MVGDAQGRRTEDKSVALPQEIQFGLGELPKRRAWTAWVEVVAGHMHLTSSVCTRLQMVREVQGLMV